MTEQFSPAITPATVVETFLSALRDKDYDAMTALLAEDVVYHNVGTPVIRGRRRAITFLRGLNRPSMGFDVKIHRIATEGTAVLTERTDVLIFRSFQMHFWVCGVFEVHDGAITLWRDYFDVLDMLKAAVRGLAAVVLPSLRRSL